MTATCMAQSPNPPTPGAGNERDARCECGSLLARWFDEGVELKCRRCKRVVLINVRTRSIHVQPADNPKGQSSGGQGRHR